MIVLVTGGAGFISSHLCERLIKMGAHVRCFDNIWRGSSENIAEIRNAATTKHHIHLHATHIKQSANLCTGATLTNIQR